MDNSKKRCSPPIPVKIPSPSSYAKPGLYHQTPAQPVTGTIGKSIRVTLSSSRSAKGGPVGGRPVMLATLVTEPAVTSAAVVM
jgi:hypothetical protein